MGLYLFENPKTGETKEVFFNMNDEKIFVDENGLKWERRYTVPQGSIPCQIDPNNPNSFIEATKSKRGTLSNLLDLSEEASQKRKKMHGEDKFQNSFFDQWSFKRKNRVHPLDKRHKK